jgi:hypothetical protein
MTSLRQLQPEPDQVILDSQDRQGYAIPDADHVSGAKVEHHRKTSLQGWQDTGIVAGATGLGQ